MSDTVDPPEPSETGGEGSIQLVGTAHVSAESAERVERTIEDEQPDVVAVELDEGRFRQLKGESPDDIEASDLLQGNTVFQFLAYWMLSYVQARLGDRFDVTPGADMMAGVETAEAEGIDVALVDRDIQTTIQRFWKRLTGVEKAKLFFGMLVGIAGPWTAAWTIGLMVGMFAGILGSALGFSILGILGLTVPYASVLDVFLLAGAVGTVIALPLVAAFSGFDEDEDPEEFDIEQLTDTDVVSAMMEEFRRFSPGGAEALIDERDAYIAHQLVGLREEGYHVVAVVGAGHRAGIQGYLDRPAELPPMDSLTGTISGRRFSLYKILGYLFTLGFAAFFVLLLLGGAEQGWLLRLFAAWFLVNGVIAAALAKVAGAHWSSAGVGGAVAWLTSVNPLLAPGWFAGYVELRYLDVNVSDISRLNELLDDQELPIPELVARMREVPLFRLILIVALTNIGSFIASMLFASTILPLMSNEVGGVAEVAELLIMGAQNGAEMLWNLLG
ncbi:TraB/GumN family protein [Halorhabdus sp. BNX81]|uniref:TraB/GumN family protein n=1 Tax=Halorhabdus sp. BNX81 TaxID=2980181 RepID=UPI0023DD02C9|nr:TraB/GumN family protein [Halorhabdus sp. BNX81]WEL21195.1 Pheromone shutdown protein TraB, contains GTxH motif [Halorhabdus sp. BNX81]